MITKVFGELEETVTVGSPLFEVDETQLMQEAVRKEQAKPDSSIVPTVESRNTTTRDYSRVPLIKFLGKRALLPRSDNIATEEEKFTVKDFVSFKEEYHLFKSIKVTEAEILAVNSGIKETI